LKIEINNINDYTREMKLDVPWETLEPDFNITLKKFSKKVKLPGFRPGKIPRDRLMQQFQPNIEAQFMDDNIYKYYLTALQQKEIVPVNQAEISDVHFHFGEHFSFTAKFEVEPDFKLPRFKKNMFQVQRNKFIPDEQDINDAIDQLRRSHARIETIEDGAKEKDFILCDLQKLDDSGVAIIGKKFEKQMLKVGDGSFTDDQKEKLIGLKLGDSARIELPDNEDKTITSPYELKVTKVERENLPEVDNDFFKLINPELGSVDDLRADVLKKINENFEERALQSFERELSDALIDKVGFETPPSMVENYLNNILEDVKKQNNGEPIEEEKVHETYRPSAERNLKWYLIRKKVISQEQINIERKDIDAEIENLVSRSPNSEKEIRRFYKKPSNRQRIEDDMVEKKILEYLNRFAKVKEVEVNTKDIRGDNK
jgi:trigger factor